MTCEVGPHSPGNLASQYFKKYSTQESFTKFMMFTFRFYDFSSKFFFLTHKIALTTTLTDYILRQQIKGKNEI